ncbi:MULTISPECIES: LysR family transcriptional regulator [Modicisalibacter]|uniref:LysR family transcriptional regulator n=1 Tax=Modicisalibacter TaxID=574347 RepID=UPI00100B7888|nr:MULTISPECIES: LysR family transcriptional regulator [Halomonadaceae]MBZ9556639.1 LysR family transcriptional regulator [Modicisalibacter sp. R2A 31.J]MBZ9574892.1 LysR family transcriptional regulator [Modicisalibacter sp. MOD 31.J]
MEIRWLEDFITLARTRHFSRAAEAQNVTQPTFSRRIKLLEEEMGTTLVNRQTLPLSLTPAGEEFLRLCEQITERVRLTRERIRQLDNDQARRIVVAAPQSVLSYLLPDWLARHQLTHQVEPYLRATSWLLADYFEALDRDECDLAFCYWPRQHVALELDTSGYDHLLVDEDTLIPVSAPDDAGKPRFRLPGHRRHPLPFIAYHPQGLIKSVIEAHLMRLSQPAHLITLNENVQTANIKELVSQGYGLGWLPLRTIRRALESGELVRAGAHQWDIPLEIRLYRSRHNRHPGLDALWRQLQETQDDS